MSGHSPDDRQGLDTPTVHLGFQGPSAPPAGVPSAAGYGHAPVHAPPPSSNGWAVAALVLGIITLALSPVPILNQAGILVGIVGVGIGIAALVIGLRCRARHIMAGVGLGLSVVGLVASFAFTAAYVQAIDDAFTDLPSASSAPVAGSPFSDETAPITYTLEATSSASTGLVTWSNGEGGIEQDMSASMPWKREITVDPSRGTGTNFSIMSPSNGRASSYTVSCTIKANGQVLDTQTSRGQVASASCQVY